MYLVPPCKFVKIVYLPSQNVTALTGIINTAGNRNLLVTYYTNFNFLDFRFPKSSDFSDFK